MNSRAAQRGAAAGDSLAQQAYGQLRAFSDRRRWCLGYSGGMDSSVLLHLLQQMRARETIPELHALHVHHGLSSAADDWERHCREQCRHRAVDFHSVRVQCDATGGPEAAARRARYRAFADFLQPGDLLLLAHHLDDQAETLLLRLCRGPGGAFAGMPASRPLARAELARPLLNFPRRALREYAAAHGLDWVEDASNRDDSRDRNWLRRRVLPMVEQRWGAYRSSWGRVAEQAAEMQALNEQLAMLDLGELPAAAVLPTERLQCLVPSRQRNLLRYWLHGLGCRAPGGGRLDEILKEMLGAAPDAVPCIRLAHGQLRRYRGCIHWLPLDPPPALGEHGWDPRQPLRLPGMGELQAAPSQSGGLRASPRFRVHFRRGGERCHPQSRRHSRPLKKLLQEYGVPPWLRRRVPLVSVDGQLAAVGDLWVCRGFAAAPGEAALRLHWQPPGGTGATVR